MSEESETVKTFLEIGASEDPMFLCLLMPRWFDHILCDTLPYIFPIWDESALWKGVFVEPHPPSIVNLIRNLEANNISDTVYDIFSGAVTDKTEKIEFQTDTLNHQDTSAQVVQEDQESLFATADDYLPNIKLFYQSMTLDFILESIAEPCSLLRIDAEGSELKILEGFSFSQKPQMIIECHETNDEKFHTALRVIEILKDNGYYVFPEHPAITRLPYFTLFGYFND